MNCPGESARRTCLAISLAASLSLSLSCASPPADDAVELAVEGRGRGTLVGTVRLEVGAPIPEPRVIRNTTDPEVCGESHQLRDVAVSPDRGLSDVIVAFTDVPAEPAAPTTLTLDNRDCRFSPHVAVATLGSLLETTNHDPVLHTTHLYGPREVNVSLPVMGARQTRILAAPGLFVIKCDVHGWMEAYLRVDEHPYHAVSSPAGAFRIEGVPAGKRRIEIWHPQLGTLAREVEITPDGTTSIEVAFEEEETHR